MSTTTNHKRGTNLRLRIAPRTPRPENCNNGTSLVGMVTVSESVNLLSSRHNTPPATAATASTAATACSVTNGDETGCSRSERHQNCLRIAVIGSCKVGKTHLIQQLVHCQPPSLPSQLSPQSSSAVSMAPPCCCSNTPTIHYPIVIFNEHLYHVSLIDCPFLETFPADSLQDWTYLGGHNIRDASGYILVFDVTSEASFQYIKSVREQMLELGIEAPIVIAANKVDLLCSNGRFLPRNSKREMSAIVKKHWKGSVLIECSSRYNWRVLSVFKELMRMIDSRDNNPKQTAARAMHNALRRNQCSIM